MASLRESALEREIYAYVTGVVNEYVRRSGGSDVVYNEAQRALVLVYEELMAQRFSALHFKQEALRVKGD